MALSQATTSKIGDWYSRSGGGDVAPRSAFDPAKPTVSNDGGLLASTAPTDKPKLENSTSDTGLLASAATAPGPLANATAATDTSSIDAQRDAAYAAERKRAEAQAAAGTGGSLTVNDKGEFSTDTPAPATDAANPRPAPTPKPTDPREGTSLEANPVDEPGLDGPAPPATAPGGAAVPAGAATLNPGDLANRTVDPGTETVEGRLNHLLDANGQYIQQARDQTRREGEARGLLNSSISASAGEEAAIGAAMPIATSDAATYGRAGDYNTALHNQAQMYNADTVNHFLEQSNALSSAERVAQLQSMTQREIAQVQAHVAQQVASQQAAASVANAQASAAAARYGADSAQATAAAANAAAAQRNLDSINARQHEVETQIAGTAAQNTAHDQTAVLNNIINNNDMPPEVRDRMLIALGHPELAHLFTSDPDLTNNGHNTDNSGNGTSTDSGG